MVRVRCCVHRQRRSSWCCIKFPNGAPPDSNTAAETIDSVSGASVTVTGTYEHDAETVKIDGNTITMQNEHSESRETLRYGSVVAVNGFDRLENIAHGSSFEAESEDEIDDPFTDAGTEFFEAIAQAAEQNAGEWNSADGELHVATVEIEPEEQTSVTAEPQVSEVEFEDEVDVEMSTAVEFSHEGQSAGHWDWRAVGTKSVWDNDEFDDSDSFSDFLSSVGCDYLGFGCDDDDPEPSQVADSTTYFDGQGTEISRPFEYYMIPNDADLWTGDYSSSEPLEIEVSYDDGDHEITCSGDLTPANEGNPMELCPGMTGPDEFGDTHWVETDDDEETYYVTIVVV